MPGDFAAVGKGEPKVAVLAHRDRERLGASTDWEAFEPRRLGGSAAGREDQCGDAAREFETKLTPGGCKIYNGRFDEIKRCCHGGQQDWSVFANSKLQWVTPLLPLITLRYVTRPAISQHRISQTEYPGRAGVRSANFRAFSCG